MTEGPRICHEGGEDLGWFLPTEVESKIPDGLRVVIYTLGLIYWFLGISIVADIFMASIGAVTSRKSQRHLPSGVLETTKVWNETVATLSLMALGSSAPEIFLSMLDLFKKDMHSGDLGSATIVGSAAFNFFVIIGVCCYAIPSGEVRVLEALPAFFTTVFFSMAAYMWLAFILVVWTPDIVEPWEGVVTFLCLPFFIWLSYSIDCGMVRRLMEKHIKGIEPSQLKSTQGRACISFKSCMLHIGRSSRAQSFTAQVFCSGERRKEVTCAYRTERIDAVPGGDYIEAEGTLTFPEGITEAYISLNFPASRRAKNARRFLLILENATGNAVFDPFGDGGESSSTLTVTMEDLKVNGADRWLLLDAFVNLEAIQFASCKWATQVQDAIAGNADGDDDEEDEEEEKSSASKAYAMTMQLLMWPWNVFFSIVVPPTDFCGGWVCFAVSISLIGVLTAFVSDFAELFGCVIDLPNIATAITVVALGTSMPDLFASLVAAKDDPNADASIVNVTGSNAVNVFLGLGIPWTIGAYYWSSTARDDDWVSRYAEVIDVTSVDGAAFVVESGNIGFCVVTFCACSCSALFLLVWRRKFVGGELGGPQQSKKSSALCFLMLWVVFVVACCWRVLRCEGAQPGDWCKAQVSEQLLVGGICCCFCVGMTIYAAYSAYIHGTVASNPLQIEDVEADEIPKHAELVPVSPAPSDPKPAEVEAQAAGFTPEELAMVSTSTLEHEVKGNIPRSSWQFKGATTGFTRPA